MSNEFFLDTAYAIALSVESDDHHQRAEESAEQEEFDQSAFSGRLTIAQRFIAGKAMGFLPKSVKRTIENSCNAVRRSAVRYTDCVFTRSHPSSKLLGYCHSSAARTN